MTSLEHIKARHSALLAEYSQECGLSESEWLVEKLIEKENELAFIEKFLTQYEDDYARIYKDGGKWAAETSGYSSNEYSNGDTIQESIRNFYKAQESEEK